MMIDLRQALSNSWFAAIPAFLTALISLPIVLKLARTFHWYDQDGPLKIHTQPIPRLGGISIALGLGWAALAFKDVSLRSSFLLMATFLMVWMTGLVDDLRNLPAVIRLFVQLAAGVLLALAGWSLPLTGIPILNLLATSLFVASFINAFNLLDGADGVAGGVVLAILVGYAILSAGQISPAARQIAITLAGSCAAFLVFNFPPARIFMGDSGSTLLGLTVAFLGLDFSRAGTGPGSRILFPLVISAVPVVDLTLAIARRVRRRASLFEGDRQHFYDLLLQNGWGARRVAVTCGLLSALFVVIGTIGIQQPTVVFVIMVVGAIIPLIYAAIFLGSLRTTSNHARG